MSSTSIRPQNLFNNNPFQDLAPYTLSENINFFSESTTTAAITAAASGSSSSSLDSNTTSGEMNLNNRAILNEQTSNHYQQLADTTNNNNQMMIPLPYQQFILDNNNVNVAQFYQVITQNTNANNNLRYQVPQQEFQKQDLGQKMFSEANPQPVNTRGTFEIQQSVLRNAQRSNLTPQLDQTGEWQQFPLKDCDMITQVYGSILQGPYPSPNIVTPLEAIQAPYSSQPHSIRFGEDINVQYAPYQYDQHTYADAQYDHDYQQPPTPSSNSSSRPPSPNLLNQKPPVYTKWTEDEDQLLRSAISIYGPHKWSLIAAHVPNRTPMQCSTRWSGALNPTIHKGRWTPEEDAALKDAVAEYVDLIDSDGNPQPIPWNKIAARIPHRTGIQCQARWSEALDPRVRKGKWSPEEDDILKEGVRRFGRCWIRIAEMIEGRTQRQCRTRWVQIKNKQAKLERDAIAAATASVGVPNDNSDENMTLLSPPTTTPPTPTLTSTIAQNVLISECRTAVQTALRHSAPSPLDLSQIRNHYQGGLFAGNNSANSGCALENQNSPIEFKYNQRHSPSRAVFSSPSPHSSLANSPLSESCVTTRRPSAHQSSPSSINLSPSMNSRTSGMGLAITLEAPCTESMIYNTTNRVSSGQQYSYIM